MNFYKVSKHIDKSIIFIEISNYNFRLDFNLLPNTFICIKFYKMKMFQKELKCHSSNELFVAL